MNRRHFVRTTGFSLGAFFITPAITGSPREQRGNSTIRLPDEVTAVSDDRTFPLRSRDDRSWTANGVQVSLVDVRNAVAADVQSPKENLRSIVLRWKHRKRASTTCLGDQWERSYGDLRWAPIDGERILPWYFMEYDGKVTNGFGVKTGCRSMCFWEAGTDNLQLTIDVRSGGNGVALGERVLRAAEIVVRKGKEGDSPFAATRAFCRLMCESPRLPKRPVYGINDWYFTYGNNSEKVILEHARLTADLAEENSNRPFCVIDAGWATRSPRRPDDPAWGDNFSSWNPNFGDMAALANKIRGIGMQPGIWVRPLCASVNDPQSRILPIIPGRDDPGSPILDPTIPENIQRVKGYFTLCRQWGYDLIKHDFTTFDILGKWGFQMFQTRDITSGHWRFNDNSLTNAEIMLNMYSAFREAAGETCLIGCNTVGHLSAGLVELQRIGDDTSGREWRRTMTMGVNTLGFRIPQHETFFSADPDCVGLTTQIPWEKNRQWMQLVAESGTPLFVSAQKEAVGEAQREFIRRSFKTASEVQKPGEPLDWLTNPTPVRWSLGGREVEFNWE
jgi:hypothetical protein